MKKFPLFSEHTLCKCEARQRKQFSQSDGYGKGDFQGPQIRQLMLDCDFEKGLTDLQRQTWLSLKAVINNFLGNKKSSNIAEIEKRYQGKWIVNASADYCWSFMTDKPNTHHRRRRYISRNFLVAYSAFFPLRKEKQNMTKMLGFILHLKADAKLTNVNEITA